MDDLKAIHLGRSLLQQQYFYHLPLLTIRGLVTHKPSTDR